MAGKNDGKIRCSFCGKTQDQVGRMISGPNGAFICDECVDICAEIIEEENLEEKAPASAKEEINLIKPEEMKAFLDDYVIGQDQAKKVLSVAVYNHYKRVLADQENDVELQKSNILMLGPTGSGKTLLAQTLARVLNVPFAIADATTLTEAGYVFSLLGQDYTLYVQSDTVSVNQATEAIWQTVPLVILGIFFMSILFSVIYSRYITKPIIELSSTSQKMAQLNFEPHGNSNRSDEIGILSDSLNTLADNLQHTLAELKKSNSELEAEISKERELEKKQQEFFSAASHELKTPLTILKGHLMGMLNKVKGYENQESYMERSLAVVEKMETLVKELLYVSKTDGKQRTEYKTIDFAELLRVQIADVTDLLSEKEISLSVDIPDKILCDADPAQMERAIQNVLVNAIRYSPNGEAIYISLSNDKNTVSCKVENTGVHIPEEMIPHLFEAFYRADTSRNRNTGGTGLGLYIVRKIMELHHAKYGIQNTSRGVVFWLEMPQERGAINSI